MTAYHQLPERFASQAVTIHLAGCGGNGSQMLTGLARLDRAWRSLGHPEGLHVAAFDPDTVSGANVGRQLFYERDIGKHKATVLVDRVNACYGLSWVDVPEAYTGAPSYRGILGPGTSTRQASDILITCVDSAKARREIYQGITEHHYGMNATPRYWLDLGNRQVDGQVILGEPADAINARANGKSLRLPTVVDIFPELLDETVPEDNRPSCSLAEALETQDLFINDHVSRWALQLLWTLFRRGKILHHGYFINLADGEVRPLPVPGAQPATPKKRKARRG